MLLCSCLRLFGASPTRPGGGATLYASLFVLICIKSETHVIFSYFFYTCRKYLVPKFRGGARLFCLMDELCFSLVLGLTARGPC